MHQNELTLIVAAGLLAIAVACQVLSRRLDSLEPPEPEPQPQLEDFEVFRLVRGPEDYFLVVAASRGAEAIATVERWVDDPELAITWIEGDMLIEQIEARCLGGKPWGKETRHASNNAADG